MSSWHQTKITDVLAALQLATAVKSFRGQIA